MEEHPPKPSARREDGVVRKAGSGSGLNPQPSPWVLVGAGLELTATVVVMALLGDWLDRRYQTSPLFLLALLATGTCAGIYRLWKIGSRFF